MATFGTTMTQIEAFLDTLFYNPGRRFIDATDIVNLANMAAIQVARDLGGIRLLDDTILTVVGQRDYTHNDQHRKLIKAQQIRNLGLATEVIQPLDILDATRSQSLATATTLPSQTPNVDYSTFIQHFPETNTIRLSGVPLVAGDVIRCWWNSLSNVLGPGVTYVGQPEEIPALVYKMCANGRRRFMEMNAGQAWENLYDKEIMSIHKFRSKARRVLQMGDGRFETTALRSHDGSL